MRRSSRELWASFFAILAITAIYLYAVSVFNGIPRASGLFGHGIGILGFILMLMTETLYTLRKRSRRARWGRMSTWLNFHIFTGIVGPYMALLHTSWKFNGLAGIVMLLTVIIVISGFVGRYIYTAVPRTADGAEIEAGVLEQQIAATEAEVHSWLSANPVAAHQLDPGLAIAAGEMSVSLAGMTRGWQQRQRWRRLKRSTDAATRLQLVQLEKLSRRQDTLRRQTASFAQARRMLAVWHTIHIPIGMVLFTAAFIHIVAAIYYATLLR
jgi:hypothetical protein